MRFLKTVGLVLLVGFAINLLFAVSLVLADYNKALGTNFGRTVLLMIAFVIVRLWQQRDRSVTFTLSEPIPGFDIIKSKKILMRALVLMIVAAGGVWFGNTQRPLFASRPLMFDDLPPQQT